MCQGYFVFLQKITVMKERVAYYDVLNVISCFSVVCLHSNGMIHTFIKDDIWWLRVLIEVCSFFAVPIFFMLSGATLLSYRTKYSTKQFYRKRFVRTVIPYLFWSITFYGLYMIEHGACPWKEVINGLTTGLVPYTYYWFFIPLFLIYLFIPFLALMVNQLNKKNLLILCILLVILQSIIPTIYLLMGMDIQFQLPIGGFFTFTLLGYLLSISDYESNNKCMLWIISLSLTSLIIRYIIIYEAAAKPYGLFSYFGLYSFLPPIAIFMVIKRKVQHRTVHRIWSFLAKRSFGVYLLHFFIICVLRKHIPYTSLLFITFGTIIVYFMAVFITYALQKNRYIRYILP